MVLPEVTEVQRLELRPGDALVVRLDARAVGPDDARQVRHSVRGILGRPDLRVLVLARGDSVEVIGGPDEGS